MKSNQNTPSDHGRTLTDEDLRAMNQLVSTAVQIAVEEILKHPVKEAPVHLATYVLPRAMLTAKLFRSTCPERCCGCLETMVTMSIMAGVARSLMATIGGTHGLDSEEHVRDNATGVITKNSKSSTPPASGRN